MATTTGDASQASVCHVTRVTLPSLPVGFLRGPTQSSGPRRPSGSVVLGLRS